MRAARWSDWRHREPQTLHPVWRPRGGGCAASHPPARARPSGPPEPDRSPREGAPGTGPRYAGQEAPCRWPDAAQRGGSAVGMPYTRIYLILERSTIETLLSAPAQRQSVLSDAGGHGRIEEREWASPHC